MNTLQNPSASLTYQTTLEPGRAVIEFDLSNDAEREFYIKCLKMIHASDPTSQLVIDQAVITAGGIPEPTFGESPSLPQ